MRRFVFLITAFLFCISISCVPTPSSGVSQAIETSKDTTKLNAAEGSRVVLEGENLYVAINSNSALFFLSEEKVPVEKAKAIWQKYDLDDISYQIAFYKGTDTLNLRKNELYCYDGGPCLFYDDEYVE